MKKLKEKELPLILGGGYWMTYPDGSRVYVETDEEGDDDDIIYGW